jgi:hypothetical protein
MALSVQIVVFWVVTLESIGDGYQISGGTYCLLLQGKAIRGGCIQNFKMHCHTEDHTLNIKHADQMADRSTLHLSASFNFTYVCIRMYNSTP